MVYKEHYIELYVNGKKVDLEAQKSLNLRFNDVLFDPTKISSTQASYSFEFELPSTPNNDRIFNYANNLSKLDKFHSRWNAELYADGSKIFSGSLTLNSYKDKTYKANLVSVKNYSLDDIFGEMTMNEIKNWKIDFNGVETINQINSGDTSDVAFPLISYGVFQKSPKNKDDSIKEFTSKFDIDEYNRWYVESFPPSHSLLGTLKHAFESKGYVVGGDIFQNKHLRNMYMSVNLSDDQSPEYNVGNPRFGGVDLSATITTNGSSYIQELQFPYFKVLDKENGDWLYNFSDINIYDVLEKGTVTLNTQHPSYMYQPDENIIVIPADGFYKIELSAYTKLNTSGTIQATQYTLDPLDNSLSEENLDLPVGLREITPVEIQLVRNYDDNIELIKGKYNKKYFIGNPNIPTYTINGRTYDNGWLWETCFPHEDLYGAEIPTKQNDLTVVKRGGLRGAVASNTTTTTETGDGTTPRGGKRSRTRAGTIDITNNGGRYYQKTTFGYVYNDNEVMCYDQAVSPAFICGLSSMSIDGVRSVMRDGYSWSKNTADKNESFYNEIGYSLLKQNENGDLVTEQSDYNQNSYINAPVGYIRVSNTEMLGSLPCIVRLNKNDVLQLKEVHRGYMRDESIVTYGTTTTVNLKISAFSPRSYYDIKSSKSNRYEAQTEFDVQLNLANFLNSEKKVSEWVQNVVDAFNLEVIQNGNNVTINTKKKVGSNLLTAVNVDDRVNSNEAEAIAIDYPRSMSVMYKIDTDEWGFERSAVDAAGGDESILNDDNWKLSGDSGFSVVMLNDDTYQTSTSDKSLQYSYTWYQNFNWYAVNSSFEKTSNTPVIIRTPCISKYSYMIDGYDYEESMKHDGFGLSQRFWYKPQSTSAYVWTRTYPVESVSIYVPSNIYDGVNLSYKNTENSLLKEFFSINAYLSSNFVELDVYLSSDEYTRIKNGCLVHFDSDLYIPVEVGGFDPSGYNPTTLKLMKKVV